MVGVVTTAYLVGKASMAAARIIDADEIESGISEDPKQRFKEQTHQTWRLYVPAGVSGALTIGCIIGASKAQSNRTTAAVAAYSLTEKAFTEYKERVVEQIGKGQEQKIRDRIAQDRVDKKPPPPAGVMIAGSGQILCCELYTGRYFRSDMESLRKAQNDINAKIMTNLYVVLEDFYHLVGLAYTTESGNLGWDSNKLMDLQFSAVMTESGEPCLAFEYNYVKPIH